MLNSTYSPPTREPYHEHRQHRSHEELAIIGIELLVRELGTEVARNFIQQAFERYPSVVDAVD
jgi:hypothetical protein